MAKLSSDDVSLISDKFSSLETGARYFLPGVANKLYSYSFFDATDPAIMNVVPYFDASGNPLPSVTLRQEELHAGNWLIELPVIEFVGSADKVSCILFDPTAEGRGDYDAKENPYIVLMRKVQNAIRDKVRYGNFDCVNWQSLLKTEGDKGKSVLPWYKRRAFVQALLWHEGKAALLDPQTGLPEGLKPGDQTLPIYKLSSTAAQLLKNSVVAAAHSQIDLLDLRANRYMALYNPAKFTESEIDAEKFMELQRNQQAGWGQAGAINPAMPGSPLGHIPGQNPPGTGGGGYRNQQTGAMETATYAVTMCKSAMMRMSSVDPAGKLQRGAPFAIPSYDLSAYAPQIYSRWKRWTDIFDIPEHEKLAEMLAKALADKRLLLEYAWGDTKYLTDEVKGILANRAVIPTGTSDLDDANRAAQQNANWAAAGQQAWGGPQHYVPQAYPQQGYAPQGYPQGAPQGYPQGAPQVYPQGAPQVAPQGYPQGAPQGYPQGVPQGYPQGVQVPATVQGYPNTTAAPPVSPQGYPQGYPQGAAAPTMPPGYPQQFPGQPVPPQNVQPPVGQPGALDQFIHKPAQIPQYPAN